MHWFIDPVKNHYADFEGRAGRQEFWMYVLIYLVIYFILHVIEKATGLPLNILFALAVLLPSIAITARRLHDTGMSGWWQLIGLIPVLGLIIMIILTVREGEKGENAYGPASQAADAEGKEPPAADPAPASEEVPKTQENTDEAETPAEQTDTNDDSSRPSGQ